MYLYVLSRRESWDKVLARIKQLPTQAAVTELFSKDELGDTSLACAATNEGPVEVLESMLSLAKLDTKKRNILDIADIGLRLSMHIISTFHHDPAAIKLLVRRYPAALLAKSCSGHPPPGLYPPAQHEPRSRGPPARAHLRPPRHHAPPLHQARLRLRPQEQAPTHGDDRRAQYPARV